MATPFLTSEEYDERAHRLYDAGDYDGALRLLKEGIRLYPHAVELHLGLGFTRLAREEFVWAKQAFEKALVLDPESEDAMVGLGEALFRFGRRAEALTLFRRVRDLGYADDLELLLAMGRTLYRERLYDRARELFTEAVTLYPDSAEAMAALGYTLHRLGKPSAAQRRLRRALELEPAYHEARIYLGHLLYDRGEWRSALQQFEDVPPPEHLDPLAVWRVIELKRALEGRAADDPALSPWEDRLKELDDEVDPVDALLAEVQASAAADGPAEAGPSVHRVRTLDGVVCAGSWGEIVQQLRDARGRPGESVAQFMRREAERARTETGVVVAWHEPEAFVRGIARAGLLTIEY